MPINYSIAADVVDIKDDSPRAGDAFLVDSNVWYWMTYTRASQSAQPHQIQSYPKYVDNGLAIGAQLYRCGLSLAELAHLIEKTEREIFEKRARPTKAKEYRHNYPPERANVVAEVQAAWGQVKTMASPLDITIDNNLTDAAVSRFAKECLDGYDLFILELMLKASVLQLITDDGDFATVHGIRVFTANRNVIMAAQQQGRLIKR